MPTYPCQVSKVMQKAVCNYCLLVTMNFSLISPNRITMNSDQSDQSDQCEILNLVSKGHNMIIIGQVRNTCLSAIIDQYCKIILGTFYLRNNRSWISLTWTSFLHQVSALNRLWNLNLTLEVCLADLNVLMIIVWMYSLSADIQA